MESISWKKSYDFTAQYLVLDAIPVPLPTCQSIIFQCPIASSPLKRDSPTCAWTVTCYNYSDISAVTDR